MRILFFGDIFGKPGRDALRKVLPELRSKYEADVVLADVDNLAHGRGITRKSLSDFSELGVDYMSAGNHAFDHKESWGIFESGKFPVLRPANFPAHFPGQGFVVLKVYSQNLLFAHLMGKVLMRPEVNDPIESADNILLRYSLKGGGGEEEVSAIVIDWHTEVTSETKMLGWYLDGKVSAVLGTHTHVQTADERVMPGGTAYITDVGMTGPRDSVIGMDPALSLEHFRKASPLKLEPAQGPAQVCGVFVEIDNSTGKALKIERINEIVDNL